MVQVVVGANSSSLAPAQWGKRKAVKMYDKKTLVDLLVATASTDTTAPPCWRTNEVLGGIERLVLVTENRPEDFASIAELATRSVADPAVAALLRLAVINGSRRTETMASDAVNGMFTTVKQEIAALPPGSRKDRCASFARYQARVFLARNGFYAEAAEAETEEAVAATMPDKQAVSRFLSSVYSMWAALVVGDSEKIDAALGNIKTDLPRLRADLAGSDVELQWSHGNGPIHQLQALLLTNNHLDDSWKAELADLRQHADRLGNAFAGWISILEAEDMFRRNLVNDALAAVEKIIDGNHSPDIKAAARLIRTRELFSARELFSERPTSQLVRDEYGLIKPCPDGHFIAAVAARELAAIGQ